MNIKMVLCRNSALFKNPHLASISDVNQPIAILITHSLLQGRHIRCIVCEAAVRLDDGQRYFISLNKNDFTALVFNYFP